MIWKGHADYYDIVVNDIVSSWMSSDKHRTWLLCLHLKHVGVGIAVSDDNIVAY